MTIEEMQARRRELGFSYYMLSQVSGVPLGTVQKIFGGITTAPRRGTIQRLEAALTGIYPLSPVDSSVRFSGDVDWDEINDDSDGVLREDAASYDAGNAARQLPGGPTPEAEDTTGSGQGSGADGRTAAEEPEIKKPPTWIDPARQGSYTVTDLKRFPERMRVELINGWIIVLEAPSFIHQQISAEMFKKFSKIVDKHKGECLVLTAPLDVRFSEEDRKNLVQPDLLVLCDHRKIRSKGCLGAPDLLVEILSPGTRTKDMNSKLSIYTEGGVREYWLVDPGKEKVVIYPLEESVLPEVYEFGDEIPVHIWPGESLCLRDVSEQIAYFKGLEDFHRELEWEGGEE